MAGPWGLLFRSISTSSVNVWVTEETQANIRQLSITTNTLSVYAGVPGGYGNTINVDRRTTGIFSNDLGNLDFQSNVMYVADTPGVTRISHISNAVSSFLLGYDVLALTVHRGKLYYVDKRTTSGKKKFPPPVYHQAQKMSSCAASAKHGMFVPTAGGNLFFL